jgi:hypothetical protein
MYVEECPFKIVRTNGSDEVLARGREPARWPAAFETATVAIEFELVDPLRATRRLLGQKREAWLEKSRQSAEAGSFGHCVPTGPGGGRNSFPRARLRHCTLVSVSRGGCSFQFGRASAPMIPQPVHTIRAPKAGTAMSSGQRSALSTASRWQFQQ